MLNVIKCPIFLKQWTTNKINLYGYAIKNNVRKEIEIWRMMKTVFVFLRYPGSLSVDMHFTFISDFFYFLIFYENGGGKVWHLLHLTVLTNWCLERNTDLIHKNMSRQEIVKSDTNFPLKLLYKGKLLSNWYIAESEICK